MRSLTVTLLLGLLSCTTASLAQPAIDITEPGQHPPSVGFADSHDVSALLAYRLPSWRTRIWTLNGGLNGAARNMSSPPQSSLASALVNFDLHSGAHWQWEGEPRQTEFDASVSSTMSHQNDRTDSRKNTYDDLRTTVDLSASHRQYVSRCWAVVLGARGYWGYSGAKREEIDSGDATATRQDRRVYETRSSAGLGLGRIRDVTPLIRAARLNERLAALGHERLAEDDVVDVAQGISRRAMYQRVFSRPSRRYYEDVLGPVTQHAALDPFATFYLIEAMDEDVGARYEGWQVDLVGQAVYQHDITTDNLGVDPSPEYWRIGPVLRARWSHNPTLAHQFAVDLESSYLFYRRDNGWGFLDLRFSYLWCLADRMLWTNTLDNELQYIESTTDIRRIRRSVDVTLRSEAAFYVEDRFAIRPSLSLYFSQRESEGDTYLSRSLSYGISFSYDLDRSL